MKWIYICSPLRGDYEANTAAAIRYCREVALEGDFPIAPHIYCPQFLDDTKPDERERGLEMDMEMLELCDCVWVFGDHISEGMKQEIEMAKKLGIPVCDAQW